MYNPAKPYKQQVLDLVEATWETPYVSVSAGVYPIIQKKFRATEVSHTDGIGTKGFYHWQQRTFHEAVLDALAMNLNDMALVRAVPVTLQNHITVPMEDEGTLEIVRWIAKECRRRNIAVTGGETSYHDNMHGMDIGMTVSGFVRKPRENRLRAGDVLIGLPSNGLHSNGFSRVRELFGDELRDEFTEPTRIYLDEILELDSVVDLHGMMHITGGAFTKLLDIAREVEVVITRDHALEPQPIFRELYDRGVEDKDMYTTFNCGIGFVLSVAPRQVEEAQKITGGKVIGEVRKGLRRVAIQSLFSRRTITF